MSNLLRNTLFILTLFVLVSCKKDVNPAPSKPTGTTANIPVPVANAIDADKILAIINRYRTKGCKCGNGTVMPAVKAIKWNKNLEKAAILHSKDMYEKKYFDHVSLDGREFGTRAKNAGYKGFAYMENITQGRIGEEAIIKSWIDSKKNHCKNLMMKEVDETAVGSFANTSTMISGASK